MRLPGTFFGTLFAFTLLLPALSLGAPGAAPAHRVLVDLDAARLPLGPVQVWRNAGAAGGSCQSVLFGGATVAAVEGRKAVSFDGVKDHLVSSFTAPKGITGSHAFSVVVWALNPEVAGEETLVYWAHRGTGGRSAALNYGSSRDFGAVTHWGEPDMGFDAGVPAAGKWHLLAVTYEGGKEGTERVYVDGALSASERKTLDLWPGDPLFLGVSDDGRRFSGSLGAVLLYDRALSEDEIGGILRGTRPKAPLVHLDAAALPDGSLERWPNQGSLGGSFGRESSAPVVREVAKRRAVSFGGRSWLQASGPAALPVPFTVEAWLYQPELSPARETVLSAGGVCCNDSLASRGGAFSAPGSAGANYARKPAAGMWRHVAYVYGEDSLRLYVDGESDTEKAVAVPDGPGVPLVLGAGWDPRRDVPLDPFTGSLARLRVTRGALSQRELRNALGIYTAFGPAPADSAAEQGLSVRLAWEPGTEQARAYDVYLGEKREEVAKASPRSPLYQGRRPAPDLGPITLTLGRSYYWRVDGIDARGRVRWPGTVWSFATDTGKATAPMPRDRVAGVPSETSRLSWTPGRYAAEQRVYLGRERDAVMRGSMPALAELAGTATGCPLPAGALEPGRVYYWRVEEINGDLPASVGDVWCFRTTERPARNDVTFFVASDLHYGVTESIGPANRATIDFMNWLPGTALPEEIGGAAVGTPRGVVLTGDLTNDGKPEQWAEFAGDWGLSGEARLAYPLFEGQGNHDGGIEQAVCRAIIERNRRRAGLTRVSGNGLHYSWDWDDLHLVHTNLYPGDTRDRQGKLDGTWNEPNESLAFLKEDLTASVGTSGRPVILFLHYGWDGFSSGWGWWSEKEREALYQAIRGYNVIGLVHGHTHAAVMERWHGLDVYNVGSSQRDPDVGECFVFHLADGTLTVAHRFHNRWGIRARKAVSMGVAP